MAAGAGLRDWEDTDLEDTKARVAHHLRQLEAILPK
jgi:hypothetical protein